MPTISYTVPGMTARNFLLSTAFVRGIRGPVGSGKSALCAMEIFRRATEQRPNPKDNIRYSRWVVIRNTQPELKTTTIKTWLDWFPESDWGPFKMQPPFTHHLKIPPQPNGEPGLDCEVMFLALDVAEDVKKLYSLELTGGWINEARFVPKVILDILTERCRRFPAKKDGGQTWSGVIMDTNSMDPDHWWPLMEGITPIPEDMPEEEALMLVKPDNWEFFVQPPAMLEIKDGQGKTIGWQINPMAENLDNLDAEYYPGLIRGKTTTHIRRNVGNQIVIMKEGRSVYWAFAADRHVSSKPLPIFPNCPVHVGMDFGLTPAVLFGQYLRGRWYIQREIVSHLAGAKQMAPHIKHMLATTYRGIDEVIFTGDPAGEGGAQTDMRTPFQILQAEDIFAQPAFTNDWAVREGTVNAVLGRSTYDGLPDLIIDQRCLHLVKACSGGYHYPTVGKPGLEVRFADRPAKNFSSHVAEALQYILMGGGEGRKFLGQLGDAKAKVVSSTRKSPMGRLKQSTFVGRRGSTFRRS